MQSSIRGDTIQEGAGVVCSLLHQIPVRSRSSMGIHTYVFSFIEVIDISVIKEDFETHTIMLLHNRMLQVLWSRLASDQSLQMPLRKSLEHRIVAR